MTKFVASRCVAFQVCHSVFLAFVIRASPLAFAGIDFTVSGGCNSSKAWRVHPQHRNHAAKKDKQRNANSDEDSRAHRVVLLLLATKRGCDQFWHAARYLSQNLRLGRANL